VHWQRPHARDAISLLLERVIECDRRKAQRRHGKLTTRENEVLHWLAAGKSNAEMGEILGVSSSTVGKHLERIYEKLGVENRTAAASFYEQARST
jgi:DNA-binding CsgD family transcriptional regulator